MIDYRHIKRKWPTYLIITFILQCVCATNDVYHHNSVPSHEVYLNNPTDIQNSIFNASTVLQYINKPEPSHSCDHDKVSSRPTCTCNVLKSIATEVSRCLTLLSTGKFPQKSAKVIPIQK